MIEVGYQLSSEDHPAPDLVGYARRSEEVGFTYAVTSDHYHPWTHRQGQAPPYLVAQAAATAGTLLPGWFFLGVGTGENLNEHITGEWWPPSEVRREMLEEAVDVIRKLWAVGTVEHFGRHYAVDNARIYTRPSEPPPILVAASAGRGAELAGRIRDGLIAVSADAKLVEAFTDAGGSHKPRYGQVDVCVADNETEARRIARAQWTAPAAIPPRLLTKLRVPADFQAVAELVSEEQVCKRVVCGRDPDAHLAKIKEFVEAGFDHVHIHQVGADQETFFRFYQREVLPRTRDL